MSAGYREAELWADLVFSSANFCILYFEHISKRPAMQEKLVKKKSSSRVSVRLFDIYVNRRVALRTGMSLNQN